jgi:hypothetical protein
MVAESGMLRFSQETLRGKTQVCIVGGQQYRILEKKQIVKLTHLLDWLRTGISVKIFLWQQRAVVSGNDVDNSQWRITSTCGGIHC